ncbi:hypothetical protein A9Q98_13805 [Thalassotalea sp. 42_200_T64]|nr:hypothetical protein A9Q98_13805 [Thalassotalea sp. 42_200_T64]
MYIHQHKNEWKTEYQNEADLILSKYNGSINLYHIGSTAVSGLYAKDCIDILGVVNNTADVRAQKPNFSDVGYTYKGEYGLAGREYFSKTKRKVHLHIYQLGNLAIKKDLNFIHVMQGNLTLINELNQIKLHLHNKYPEDKDSYQRGKEYFYNKVHNML